MCIFTYIYVCIYAITCIHMFIYVCTYKFALTYLDIYRLTCTYVLLTHLPSTAENTTLFSSFGNQARRRALYFPSRSLPRHTPKLDPHYA